VKILRSTPFVLLYISVAILVAGCVFAGMRETLKPFDVLPLAIGLMSTGVALTIAAACLVAAFVADKYDDGYFDKEDDDAD
jgi:hypothetical protein